MSSVSSSVRISPSFQALFSEWTPRVKDSSYYPDSPENTLKSRMAAVRLMQSQDPTEVAIGEAFITKTSMSASLEDLQRLREFKRTVTAWNSLILCSRLDRDYGPAPGRVLEYNLDVCIGETSQVIHRHARYEALSASGRCGFLDQTIPLIRVIGDPILHQPGIPFPLESTTEEVAELNRQIKLAKTILVQTSGAGIAANQCAGIERPYAFAIVGVYHDNPAHTSGVEARYPGVAFPEAMVMVNPKVTNSSEVLGNFPHACLSVPSPNKCYVASPEEMTVEYQDPDRGMEKQTQTLKGTFAVVLWHEMNHILSAATYIDTALASLSERDLTIFEKAVQAELLRRKVEPVCATLTVPPFVFTIIMPVKGEAARLDIEALQAVLSQGLTTETLEGFMNRILALHKKKPVESVGETGVVAAPFASAHASAATKREHATSPGEPAFS